MFRKRLNSSMCFLILSILIINCNVTIVSAEENYGANISFDMEINNIYSDMEQSYSEGYKPRVKDGKVNVVLPIAADGIFKELSVTADVGTSGPLIASNRRKSFNTYHYDVSLGKYVYIIEFDFELTSEYNSGAYPVNFVINGYDAYDTKSTGNYTVYVVLEDKKADFDMVIANDMVYTGMLNSYQDGYIPTILQDTATVLLPLSVIGDYEKSISVTAKTSDSSVFKGVNYNKKFNRQSDGNYLIEFNFPLKSERKNGSYAVDFTVTANKSTFNYTVYVVVNDENNNEYDITLINDKVYSGMNNSYQNGYIPKIKKDIATVILPITVSGDYKGILSVTSRTSDSSVFNGVNYSKEFNKRKDGNYLVKFDLPLNKDRKNGSYAVELTVKAGDSSQTFTVYVVVTDEITDGLYIENKKVYSGMNLSYEKGYKPIVSNEKATVVLPIKSISDIQGDLTVKADITDNTGETFEMRNYEKSISKGKGGVYLIRFDLNLLSTKKSGVYPVKLKVSGTTTLGKSIEGEFTVYITVTGEDNLNTSPNIIIESFETEESYNGGDEFTGVVNLKNLSKEANAYNIQVQFSTQSQGIEILNNTNMIYYESMKSNSLSINLNFKAYNDATSGKHSINLDISYEDEDGNRHNTSGILYINIKQLPNVELETNGLDKNITAGDTVTLTTDVYNVGKGSIYNVTLKVEGHGLLPSKSGYVGTMNPESGESVPIDIFVGSKTMSDDYEGEEKYGFTEGKIILTYEDEDGKEYVEEHKISTQIIAPASSDSSSTVETESSWLISLIAGGCILAFTGTYLFFIKHRNKWSTS